MSQPFKFSMPKWMQAASDGSSTNSKSAAQDWPVAELNDLLAKVRALKASKRVDEAVELLDAAYARAEHPVIGHRLASTLFGQGKFSRIIEQPSLRKHDPRDFELADHLLSIDCSNTNPLLIDGHQGLDVVAYVGMVKNEEDILLFNLVWHYALGLRKFFLLDNGSTDGTRALISVFEQRFPDATVLVLNDPIVAYIQGRKMTGAFRFVQSLWPEVQWIFFIDADEFICVDRPLPNILADVHAEAAAIVFPKSVYNLVDGDSLDEDRHFFERISNRRPLANVSNKIIARAVMGSVIGPGNHRLMDRANAPPADYSSPRGLTMREFAIRSNLQHMSKVLNGGRAVEVANQAGGQKIGSHWEALYQLYLQKGEAGLRSKLLADMARDTGHAQVCDPLPLGAIMDRWLPDWRQVMAPFLAKRNANAA